MPERWPDIPFAPWRETCAHLHLMTQVVGQWRLARTPWLNHSWHATLYVEPRGLTTGPVPDGERAIEARFDFAADAVVVDAGMDKQALVPLRAGTVRDFAAGFAEAVRAVGGTPRSGGAPNEVADPVPFAEDGAERPWDRDAVLRFHAALVRVDRMFRHFRTGFLGKVSPVHLFWGSFDLAVTCFSGREAPAHPGGIPNLPDAVTREAYSHEVSSAGFWPGGGIDEATFYSYAYPAPEGFRDAPVEPADARFDEKLGEFVLPYAAVRAADDPEEYLLRFLQSTYAAAAELGL